MGVPTFFLEGDTASKITIFEEGIIIRNLSLTYKSLELFYILTSLFG